MGAVEVAESILGSEGLTLTANLSKILRILKTK